MRQHVAAAKLENAPVLEDASTLLVQRRDAITKNGLLDAFSKHFVLSEQDLGILATNADIVNDEFFRVLSRVKQIHEDCQVLLGAENQRLGLELMEANSRHLNTAYQKLYRWILREIKTVNFENPQIGSTIRRALRALAERPALFQSCLDFFAEAREHVLLDAFYSALTGSSDDNQATKPIDFHAHDALRYVGDMLAWTHSASVSEKEALESLAATDGDEIVRGIQAGTASEPWTVIDDEPFDGRRALEQLASRNLTGVLRVLRQRVEQVIHNQEDPVLTYKLVNLFGFYRVTFVKLLGPDCDILETLSMLEASALQKFKTDMQDRVSTVENEAHQISPDLHIPEYLAEALSHFQALIRSFDSSLAPASTRDEDFKRVTSVALDPFVEICKREISDFQEPARSVFLTNCLVATKTLLADHDFVQERKSQLEEELSTYTTALLEYQHAYLLHTSSLQPLLAALASMTDDASQNLSAIPDLPAFQPAILRDASQKLDNFLPSALMDAMDNLKYMTDKQLSRDITAEAAERFCEDFEYVEGALVALDDMLESQVDSVSENVDQADEHLHFREMFPRTSGEIRVLLS